MLTVDTIPLCQFPNAEWRMPISRLNPQSEIGNRQSLLRFFVISVLTATAAELAELKPIRRGLLILGRYVVSALACTTLKNNIIAWHLLNPVRC